MKINYPSISQFAQLVELKDYRPATKKEYVRYVRKLAEHFQCDPATLCEKPGPPPEASTARQCGANSANDPDSRQPPSRHRTGGAKREVSG